METRAEPIDVAGDSYLPIYDEVLKNEPQLSVPQVMILCMIIHESDQHGHSCSSVSSMAYRIHVSRNTVRSAIQKMCKMGLIRVEYHENADGGNAPIRCYSLKYSHQELCNGWVDDQS